MRRGSLAAIAIGLLLAGCGRDGERAFTDSRTPPSLSPRYWAPEGWTFGVIRQDDGLEVRYGVSAPAAVSRGHVILLPPYGEPIEAFYETARDLNARDLTVWALEPAGQSGSGRRGAERGVGHVKRFEPDAETLRRLVLEVIRPTRSETVVVAGEGAGALVALLPEARTPYVDALVLTAPDLDPKPTPQAEFWASVGFGGGRADGARGWKRPDGLLDGREGLVDAWRVANPDLRMGGPSHGWALARAAAARRVAAEAAGESRPVVLLAPSDDARAKALCDALPRCTRSPWTATPRPVHRAPETGRNAWLHQIEASFGKP